jgi:ADP-ribose pyrophosphatase YjhB (NUDIX family)
VGAIVRDRLGRLLVIKRGHPPGEGLWSIPGGRVQAGESDAEAVARELAEETGLSVRAGRPVGHVRRPGPSADVVFDIYDYEATVVAGRLAAGDDADEARWVTTADLRDLPLTPGLLDALTAWSVLPGVTGAGRATEGRENGRNPDRS